MEISILRLEVNSFLLIFEKQIIWLALKIKMKHLAPIGFSVSLNWLLFIYLFIAVFSFRSTVT